MNKEIIKITESDLHNIIKESVNKIINEMMEEGPYWFCEFEDTEGNVIPKIVWGTTTAGAFKACAEMGLYLKMEPRYETLRGATKNEVAALKRKCKRRAKKNSVINK